MRWLVQGTRLSLCVKAAGWEVGVCVTLQALKRDREREHSTSGPQD